MLLFFLLTFFKGFIIAQLVPHGTLVSCIDYFAPASILNFHPWHSPGGLLWGLILVVI